MSQINKTLAFVMCAVCSVGAAALTHYSFKPAVPKDSVQIGEPFFPDFSDPSKATSLRVAAYNEKTSKTDIFQVEFKDGQWRIPSHHNYPADGKDQLAKTAASLIGITRGQLVSASESGLKTFGVLDPLDKDIAGTEGRGSRVTLLEGDTKLADYIIGKKDSEGGDKYYVRSADEDRVYLTEVKVDLSTKFVDWIKPDLLEAASGNFRELVLDRYEVDEAKGSINQGEVSKLTKKSSAATDPWKLEGLDEAKFKVKDSVVNAMTSALVGMKIVGVRPKPPGLSAALKGEEGAALSPLDQIEMQQKGYFLTRQGALLANEGEFLAGLADGAVYKLRFGEVFTGSEVDIEIGSPAKAADPAEKKEDATAEAKKEEEKPADAAAEEKKDPDAAEDDPSKKENRYVFIEVQFDEKLLGEAPLEPVKPTPPEGYKPTKPANDAAKATETPVPSNPLAEPAAPAGDAPKAEEKSAPPEAKADPSTSAIGDESVSTLAGPPSDAPAGEKPAAEGAPAAEPAADATKEEAKTNEPAADAAKGDAKATEPAAQPAADAAAGQPVADKPAETPAAPKDPNAEYEAALKKYEQDLDEYRVRKQDHEEKVKTGQEKVKKLNDRFADWYYVISSDLYKDLKVSPEQLFEPKEPPKTPAAGAAPLSGLPLPGVGTPPESSEAPATKTPPEDGGTPETKQPEEKAEEKPAAEAAKPDDAAKETAPPETPKTEDAPPPKT
jgi:hypothetical protein